MTQQVQQTLTFPDLTASCVLHELLLAPIGFCGHAWTWMKDVQCSADFANITAIALRILAAPFFAAATLVSAGVGAIGALMSTTRSLLIDNPVANQHLLRRDILDRNVALEVKGVLEQHGCSCDVEVTSSPLFRSSDAYYAQFVSRTITLTSEGSMLGKIYQVVKNRFYHVPAVSLNDLHVTLRHHLTSQQAAVDRLNRALAEHGRVSFDLAFDLAVCKTTVG